MLTSPLRAYWTSGVSRFTAQTLSAGPDRDRHPAHGAQPLVVVGEAHVPDPRGAAAVDWRALSVHVSLSGRPEEVGRVGLSNGEVAVGRHRPVRGGRDHRLGE